MLEVKKLNQIVEKYIINQLLLNQIIDEKQVDIYAYGLQIIMATIINLFTILIAGLSTNHLVDAIWYLFIFASLRYFTGGFHCSKFINCIISTLSFFIAYLFINLLFNFFISVIMMIFSCITIFLIKPIPNKNKPLKKAKLQRNNKIGKIIISSYLLLFVILIQLDIYSYNVIAYTCFIVSILMIGGKIYNEKNYFKNDCKNN